MDWLIAVFNQLDISILVFSKDEKIVFCNTKARYQFSNIDDIELLSISSLFKKYYSDYAENPLSSVDLKKSATFVLEKEENGKAELIEWRLSELNTPSVNYNMLVGTEITTKHMLERKASQIESRLKSVIESIAGNHWWKDLNGVYRGYNQALLKNVGLKSLTEVIGKTDYDMPWAAQADKLIENDQIVIKSGKTLKFEENVMSAEGKMKTFLTTKVPLKDDKGKLIGTVGTSFDITELKETQKQLEESKVREAHFKAMSSIGGMIAHELKTPLMAIALNARSIKKFFPILMKAYREYTKISGTQEIREGYLKTLDKIADHTEQSANYADNIIKTILEGFHYSTSESVKVEKINVNEVIQRALKDYPLNKEEQALIAFQSIGECQALGSSSIIKHVLHNLLKNALYVIKSASKGSITISVKKVKDNAVQIQFQDTAKGIPEDIRKHIFKPFYTTKAAETSVGLGLYFCKIALEKMGARINCKSEEGKYTLFTIILKGPSI